jgi:hypothetical protein
VNKHQDELLVAPARRAAQLEAAISRMALAGYSVLTRTTRHQAVLSRRGWVVHIYVDEFGDLNFGTNG